MFKVQWMTAAVLVCLIALFGHQVITNVNASKHYWSQKRADLLAQLESTPEKHLIFVRYSPSHPTRHEWVYNRADIDQSKVVWAREMNSARDQALVDYYHDRRVWLLEADQSNPKLRPRYSTHLTSKRMRTLTP